MNSFQKLATRTTIAVGVGIGTMTSAFAACEEWGQQTVPPHRTDTYHFEHRFSGGPLDTLQSCLAAVAGNEDVTQRDNLGLSFEYTSSSRGNFDAVGYAEQPGADLIDPNKPRTSVAIARITSENGVNGLESGNIVEYDTRTRDFEVYANWQTFQAQSPNAGIFSRQP